MNSLIQSISSFLRRAPARLKDAAFELACRVLLPISTMCKICNILRGMAIGFLFGIAFACLAITLFVYVWWRV